MEKTPPIHTPHPLDKTLVDAFCQSENVCARNRIMSPKRKIDNPKRFVIEIVESFEGACGKRDFKKAIDRLIKMFPNCSIEIGKVDS